MSQTDEGIINLASAFMHDRNSLTFDIYVKSLESLVRLAISEHVAAPLIAAQDDMDDVERIRKSALAVRK